MQLRRLPSSSPRSPGRGSRQLRLNDGSCFMLTKKAVVNFLLKQGYKKSEMLQWPDENLYAAYRALKIDETPALDRKKTTRRRIQSASAAKSPAKAPNTAPSTPERAFSSADFFGMLRTLIKSYPDGPENEHAVKVSAHLTRLVEVREIGTASLRLRTFKKMINEKGCNRTAYSAFYESVKQDVQRVSQEVYGADLFSD